MSIDSPQPSYSIQEAIGDIAASKETDPDAAVAALLPLLRGLVQANNDMNSSMGASNDGADSAPDNESTLVSLMKGILVQQALIVTALNTVNTNLQTINTTLEGTLDVTIV